MQQLLAFACNQVVLLILLPAPEEETSGRLLLIQYSVLYMLAQDAQLHSPSSWLHQVFGRPWHGLPSMCINIEAQLPGSIQPTAYVKCAASSSVPHNVC